ncbi:MAG: tetratricopeptide repeat protein [Geitlerinemataceae cyanobacterium]
MQPVSGKVHADLGRQYDRQGKRPQAAQHYQQALQWHPDSYELWMRLGSVYHRLPDLERAKLCYDRAIALKPQEVSAHYQRAMVLNDRGQWTAAIAQYQQAIDLAGVSDRLDRANAYNNLGCIWVARHQFDRAMAAYQAARELDPESAALHNNLGELWLARGDLDRAVAAYRQALKWARDDGKIHYNLGKALQRHHQHEEAIVCFEKAIELGEDRSSIEAECGFSLLELGRRSEAMAYFHQSIAPSLGSQLGWIDRYCHRATQRIPRDTWDRAEAACAQFLTTLKEKPDDPQIDEYLTQTYINFGNVQLESGRYDRAADFYQKALDIQPHQPQVLSKLGLCLSRQQNAKRAVRVYQRALSDGEMSSQVAIEPLRGIYASTRDWAAATGNVEGYLPVCFNQTQPKKLPASAVALPPPTDAAPNCEGINCHKCLRNLFDDFELTHLGQGIQVCANSKPLEVPVWETFVAIVPGGRAWVMPQKSGWQVCEAIAIISPDNHLLADLSREYPGQLPNCQTPHPIQHRIFHREKLEPLERIEGTVAVLTGLSGNVYYHWMVDILPRLEILRRSSIDWDEIDWFLVNSVEKPFQRETLRKLGVPDDKILESDRHPHIQADRLIVPSFGGHLGWITDWTLKFLRQSFLPQKTSSIEKYPQRIYISRSSARYRHLLNESEIIKLLEKSGFTTVTLEKLSLEEQVTLFSQAKTIVAPHGSGLTNLIFCQPGTQVVEITSPHYVRHYFRAITQHLQIEHYIVLGDVFTSSPLRQLMYPSSLTEDIQVSPDAIEKVLDRMGIGCNPEPLPRILASNFQLQLGKLDDLSTSSLREIMSATLNGKLTASDYQKQAETLLAENRFEEAIAACKNALERDPNLAPVCKILGNALRASGQIEEAKYWYTKAIEIQPNYAEAHANLGNLAFQQQQWKIAIEAYQKAITHKPDFAAAHDRLAKAWEQVGRVREASECLYRAYELQPNLGKPEEHLNLGNTLLAHGQMTQAIVCYRQALDLNPQLFGAYQNLAEALSRQGNFEEANRYYRKAVQLGLTNTNLVSQPSQPALFSDDSPALETPLAEDIAQPSALPPAVSAPTPPVGKLDIAPSQIAPPQRKPSKTGLARWVSRIVSVFNSPLGSLFEASVEPNPGGTPQPPNNRPLAEEYIDFGNALLENRQINRALRCYRRAMEASADTVDATYENMEKTLLTAWEKPEPTPPPAASPRAFVEDYMGLGNVLLRSHQVGYAMHCYRRAMELNPEVSEIVYRNLESAIEETLTVDVRKKAVYLPPSREVEGQPQKTGDDDACGQTPLTQTVELPHRVVEIDRSTVSQLPSKAASPMPEAAIYPELVYQHLHDSPRGDRSHSPNLAASAASPPMKMESPSNPNPRVESLVEPIDLLEDGDSQPMSAETSTPVPEISPEEIGNHGKNLPSNSSSTFSFESAPPSREWSSVYPQEELPEPDEVNKLLPNPPKRSVNHEESWVQQAQSQFEGENFDRAIRLCQKAIETQPKMAVAYKIWADALQAKGNLAEADGQYQQAIALQPDFVTAYLTLGDRYFQAQQWQEAGGVYVRILRVVPRSTEARDRLGDICVTQGYLDRAIDYYQSALKFDSKLWSIHHKLGDILQATGRLKEATQAYRKATELAAQEIESSGDREG